MSSAESYSLPDVVRAFDVTRRDIRAQSWPLLAILSNRILARTATLALTRIDEKERRIAHLRIAF